jgi:nitrogen PTS system EIIA component
MNVSDYIDPTLNRTTFRARNKKQALARMADIACSSPLLKNETPERILQLLAEREAVVSTGIGKGIAIPHARLDTIEDFVVFVLIAPDGIEFDALDGKRVTIFFVVFAPASKVNAHLKLLAGIANTLSRGNLKNELLKTRTPDILNEILVRNFSGDDAGNQPETQRHRLLLLVLYYEEILTDILEYLIDVNVEGATITRSEGMAAHVSTIPLFASFMGFMREDRKISHTIMAVIPERDEAMIVQGIEAITGDLDRMRGAMVMTLDIAFSKGTMDML